MKREKQVIIGILIVGLLIFIPIIIHSIRENNNKNKLNINVQATSNCENIYEDVTSIPGHKVYSYCLDSIKVDDKTLEEYLNSEKNQGITNITNSMDLSETLKDGGTKIYQNKKIDLKVIICNTENNDKSIYFGPSSMPSDLCK